MANKILISVFCSLLISSAILTKNSADAASPVLLSLSATDLPASDPFGGSPDAYVKVFYAFGSAGRFEEIGSTNPVNDNKNPVWSEQIRVDDFVPGTSQRLRFQVWDDDVDGDDNLGTVEFFLAELSNSRNGTLDKDIVIGETRNGQLNIRNVHHNSSYSQ